MSAMLTICNDEEAGDIHEWLSAHQDESDWPRETAAAADWLRDATANATAYPFFVAVPSGLVAALRHAMDDWSEVLSAHDESLLTELSE